MTPVSVRQECPVCGKVFIKDLLPEEYGRWVKAGKPNKSKCNACPSPSSDAKSDDNFIQTIIAVSVAESISSDSSGGSVADASASCASDSGSSGGECLS